LLSEQLAVDPPLVLWTVCTAASAEDFRPRSIDDVSGWFREHLLEVLQWDDADRKRFSAPEGPGVDQCADRVAHVLQVAELAALLAATADQSTAEEAFLLGVLHDASQWPTLNADDAAQPLSDCLPQWLVAADQSPAAQRVGEAVGILAGEATSVPSDFDREACRQRATGARRSWLETVDTGLVDRLPALTLRLARLAQLENRFQETLDTEKLEAMAEFSAGAGHEINNPLAIIGGWAQLLLKDETDPERRRELALMNAQVKRAHEMIADVRLFARPPRPEPETVDLVELVDRMVADLAPQAAERATSLVRTGEAESLPIEVDPAQLSVALRALCKNSLEAIGHDGHVEIALGRLADNVEIRVSDDGAGILPEHRRHLFEPFYSARQAGRGLGFGLSKCWRIVTNHGGRIDVRSEPGEGAEFTITLPERWSV
jgi:signal transduction histidine kinase